MTICDRAYVKRHLNLCDDSLDARIDQWLAAVSQIIENELGYAVEAATKTEYLTGDGTSLLFLRARRVTGIEEIHVDPNGWFDQSDDPFPTSTLLAANQYALVTDDEDDTAVSWCGIVRRVNGVWPESLTTSPGELVPRRSAFRGNIKVKYTCGYAAESMPEDLKYAAAVMCSMMQRVGDAGGPVTSFSYEGFSQMFRRMPGAKEDATEVEAILANNRKWIW